MVDVDALSEMSGALFGRYQAMGVYWAVAKLAKPEFTTGMIARAAGLPVGVCSRELARLTKMGAIRQVTRKGDYERDDTTTFWASMDALAQEWTDKDGGPR